ncbi:hypothetical protein H4R19_007219 [Coemansia spiralis]|nr:hypothetical protein H4R19_007219 [Coemansia spiralis]
MAVTMRVQPDDDLSRHHGAPVLSGDDAVAAIARRYEQRGGSQPYTSIGDRFLIALNPNETLELQSDQAALQYVDDYRDTSPSREPLPPHIFRVAEQAYLHMRRTGLSQSIALM